MTPEDHLDCARSLDSKVQARDYFRAALAQCPGLRLTRAAVVRSGPGLLQEVHDALQAFGPAIIKTEFGAGGNSMGVLKGRGRLRKPVGRILPDSYDGELLVEEFLGSPRDILSVSYNGMVQDDGTIYTLCAGRHYLHAGKFYLGSSLGVGAMPDDCAAKVRKAGEAIGEATAAGGYRGPLNVDFLYRASDGGLFPLEINPRRGLGGILADMCICQFGQGYEKAVSAVAVHSVPVSNTITTYAQLRDSLLGKGFFGRESRGMVILPYSVSTLASKSEFGLAVFGTDGTSAEAALGEITRYLAPRPRRIR
jgi:carbamoylphosphate synthase large subunit